MTVAARRIAPLLLVLLAGCATQPAGEQPPAKGDRDTASQLYAGEPAVVHATEFPIQSAAEGINRGDAAWREGKLDLAVYLYVQSLAFDATPAEPFLRIGAVHEQLGNGQLAQRAYELALERDPGSAGGCERLGLLYLQDGRNDAAAGLLQRAVALQPERWRSWNGLGVLADRRADFAAAIDFYDRALAIDAKASSPMNNRGYSRFLAGDLAGAETDLKTAIRLGATRGVWTNLGKVQARQGRYADALESLLKEMDLAQAYNLLGESAMEGSDYSRAKRYFEQAVSEAPRYYEAAHRNRALADERLLAAPSSATTRVVVADTPVIADGAVIGLVERNDRVEVLRTQQGSALVRFRNRSGTQHLGWVPVASLANTP